MNVDWLQHELERVKSSDRPMKAVFTNHAACEVYSKLSERHPQSQTKSELINITDSCREAVENALRMGKQPEIDLWHESNNIYSLTNKGESLSDGFNIVAKAISNGMYEFENVTVSHANQHQHDKSHIRCVDVSNEDHNSASMNGPDVAIRLNAPDYDGTYKITDEDLLQIDIDSIAQ